LTVHRSPSGPPDPIDQLRRLQAVTDAALGSLGLDQLLEALLIRIRDALGADTSAFLLLDESGTELIARAAKGIEEEVERGVRIPVGQGFAGRIAATRTTVAIDDVDHADVLNPILREKGIKSLLGAPLLSEERILGVVHVGTLHHRRFTADDVALLEVVAQRAALAIDRALAYDEVVRLTELQREFIALAAHELRTPATTVYGLAATLAQRPDLPAETVAEIRETLHVQSDRMRRLVFVETPDTGDVVADRMVIERVVANLVANALRYGEPPVRVVGRQTDQHLRIVVEDNGKGIDPRFVPYLFERFQRSDAARSSSVGAGLGLSISRSYARAHGGDLIYDPASRGARFELVLPAEPIS
jgi:signal transduction histidine kinase